MVMRRVFVWGWREPQQGQRVYGQARCCVRGGRLVWLLGREGWWRVLVLLMVVVRWMVGQVRRGNG